MRNFQIYDPELIINKGIDRTEQISWDVARNHIDIGFVSGRVPSNLHSLLNIKPYIKEEVVLISTFSLFGHLKTIKIKHLYYLDIIGLDPHTSAQKSINSCLTRSGINCDRLFYKIQLNSTEAIKGAVKENFGVSFISFKSIKKESKLSFTFVFRIKNQRMFRTLWIISNLNRIDSIKALKIKAKILTPISDYKKNFIDKIVY